MTVFLGIFAPSLLLRVFLLGAVLIGFGIFIFKSYWSHRWTVLWKVVVGGLITLVLGWLGGPQLLDQWKSERTPPATFKYILFWGPPQITRGRPTFTEVVVDGHLLFPYGSRYRVVAACFHWDESHDPKDEKLQKSQSQDIVDRRMPIGINFDDAFQKEEQTMFQTSYFLLMVPKDVSTEHFFTERQAESMGAIKIDEATGPP